MAGHREVFYYAFNRRVLLTLIIFEQIMLTCGLFHAFVLLTQVPKVVVVAWGAERKYPEGALCVSLSIF